MVYFMENAIQDPIQVDDNWGYPDWKPPHVHSHVPYGAVLLEVHIWQKLLAFSTSKGGVWLIVGLYHCTSKWKHEASRHLTIMDPQGISNFGYPQRPWVAGDAAKTSSSAPSIDAIQPLVLR